MRALAIFALLAGLVAFGCVSGPQACGPEVDYVCGSDGHTYQNPCLAKEAGVNHTPGACPQPCRDSDFGKNPLEAGTVTKGPTKLDDACGDESSVIEYYCEGLDVRNETVSCPSGLECEAGRCAAPECEDSDGGKEPEEKGTVTRGDEIVDDYCGGETTLIEYFCDAKGMIDSEYVTCTCDDGECISLTCTDSDDGKNIYEKGTASAGTSSTDSCVGSDKVTEYYCESNVVKSSLETCGSGYSCINGACAPDVCTDSDGGKDKETYGTVKKGSETFQDSCYDGDTVKEYYCMSNEIKSQNMDCGELGECTGGRCTSPACIDSDGGNEPEVDGTVRTEDDTESDECQDLRTLTEYRCTSSGFTSSNVNCFTHFGSSAAGLCWDDVCVRAYCSESDGGKDEHVAGGANMYTTNGYNSGFDNDACIDSRTVREWFCDDGYRYNESITCDDEEICSGSRCVEALCSDTDGGQDYIIAGTVTKGVREEQDECISSTTLVEWYCSGGDVEFEKYVCPIGCNAAQRRCTPL